MLEKFKHWLQDNYDRALPWLVLIVGLPFAYAIWSNEKANIELDQQLRFEYKTKEARDLILYDLDLYEQALYGVQSFFRASDFVAEDEFNLYADGILGRDQYHGIQEVSFVKYIDIQAPETYQPFVQNIAEFTQQHAVNAATRELAPKVYVVPSNPSELYANQFESPQVKSWLIKAAEKHTPGLYTPMVGSHPNPATNRFVIYLPIYANGWVNDGVRPQRHQMYGWVTASVDASEFFASALAPILKQPLAYTIYNGNMVDGHQLVYDSLQRKKGFQHQPSRFEKHIAIGVLGHEWMLTVHSLEAFDSSIDYSRANTLGFLSLLATLALAGILFFMVDRLRTSALMQNVNRRLTLSEQRWQFAL